MKRYIVGIDLGTSNTVVAYVEAGTDEISIFDIDQLVGLGEVGARELLPSVRYHPAQGELASGDLQLPWSGADKREMQPAVIGRLARTLGAQVPGRLVTSAKSWLSHASVDRLAPILPWGADDEVGKVSPVDRKRELSGSRARCMEPSFSTRVARRSGRGAHRACIVR